MRSPVKSYAGTSVHWGKTQADLMKMFSARGIQDVQFSNISRDTAARGGLIMDEGSIAIMITFQKLETLPNGVQGMIPVRILIPNVQPDDKSLNQYYRLVYWYMKSKFEAIDTGLVEFAEEFMAHLQLNQRGTVGRLWDSFRTNYYKAVGDGTQGNANLLPPMTQEDDDDSITRAQ